MRRDDPGPYDLARLAALPMPVLFETDATALIARYKAWFEAEAGRTLYPMQVEMLLIEALAYAMSLLGHEAQAAAEQGLVAKASAAGLEALGPNRTLPRLTATPALTTLRFTASAPLAAATTIPAGVRVSAGSEATTFLTLREAPVAAGSLSVDVPAEAIEAGAAANGLAPGMVAAVLDPVPGMTAANITTTEGGADIEDAEAYRLRLANAFERISAGSLPWYRETAFDVSPAIVDVAVVRPQPCHIDIYPLTLDGAAGPELRAAVLARFNTPEVLDDRYGDLVTVKPPAAIQRAGVLTVRYRGVDAAVIKPAVEARVDAIRLDWRRRLAAVVAPSEIEVAACAVAGVVDAELTGIPFEALAGNAYLDATIAVEAVPV